MTEREIEQNRDRLISLYSDPQLLTIVAEYLIEHVGLSRHSPVVDRLAALAHCMRPGLTCVGLPTEPKTEPARGSDAHFLFQIVPTICSGMKPKYKRHLLSIAASLNPNWRSA